MFLGRLPLLPGSHLGKISTLGQLFRPSRPLAYSLNLQYLIQIHKGSSWYVHIVGIQINDESTHPHRLIIEGLTWGLMLYWI